MRNLYKIKTAFKKNNLNEIKKYHQLGVNFSYRGHRLLELIANVDEGCEQFSYFHKELFSYFDTHLTIPKRIIENLISKSILNCDVQATELIFKSHSVLDFDINFFIEQSIFIDNLEVFKFLMKYKDEADYPTYLNEALSYSSKKIQDFLWNILENNNQINIYDYSENFISNIWSGNNSVTIKLLEKGLIIPENEYKQFFKNIINFNNFELFKAFIKNHTLKENDIDFLLYFSLQQRNEELVNILLTSYVSKINNDVLFLIETWENESKEDKDSFYNNKILDILLNHLQKHDDISFNFIMDNYKEISKICLYHNMKKSIEPIYKITKKAKI